MSLRFQLWLLVCFFGALGLIAYATLSPTPAQELSAPVAQVIRRPPVDTPRDIIAPWLCILVGLGIVAWNLDIYLAIRQSREWPATKGVIEYAHVVSVPEAEDTEECSIQLAYTYVVAGRPYRSERMQLDRDTRYGKVKKAQHVLDRSFTPGKEVRVFYSPTAPEEAILVREVSRHLIDMVLLGAVIVAFGLVFLYACYHSL